MTSSPQPKRWKGDKECENEDGPVLERERERDCEREKSLNVAQGKMAVTGPAKIPIENSLMRRCLDEFESGDEMDYPKVFTPAAPDVNGNPDASAVAQRSGRDRLRYCLHSSFEPNQEIDSSPERYKGTEWRGFLGRTSNRENEYAVLFTQEPREIKPSTFWK